MREITYLDAVREALAEEMRRDPTVVLLGEDIHDPFGGVYKATRGLATEFGDVRSRRHPRGGGEGGSGGLQAGFGRRRRPPPPPPGGGVGGRGAGRGRPLPRR